MIGRAFEQHVHEQVGHAGFAVALVPRPNEDSHVDRHHFLAGVGKKEDSNTVFESVFRNAFDLSDFHDS